ncbi:MAG: bacteriocin-processing peptidase family protein [Burkholderiales bacterium]|nr:MAG: bacteriocin-processing peptidase family protein [Burkholderiales bacterium]
MIRRAATLGAALLLSGCAALFTPPQTAALLHHPPAALPAQVARSAVPFFPQERDHCGPAALAMALGDVGIAADPDRLADAVFLPSRGGSLQLEMMAGARRQGVVATRLPGELQALLSEVAAGHAVVVLQNLGLALLPRWHYAVVIGYDLPAREILLRSGTTTLERLPLRTFEYTWARSGRWAMTVLPPDRLPATVTQDQAVEAAIGFERAAPPQRAALAYRTVLQRWPENLLAGIGLGNTLAASGDAQGAQAAFLSVAERHDSAVAWLNLARLRLAAGDHDGARAAARRGLQRAESAEPAWLQAAREGLAATEHGR